MSEENDEGQGAHAEFKPITSQEELDKLIGGRIGSVKAKYADYDDLKAKASKFDEVEQANKTELQKEREAREAAEKKAARLETAQLRLDVGLAKGLTPAQARRLVGSTKEELEKDADDFLADIKPAERARTEPKKLRSGAKSGEDDGRGRAAAAVRLLRGSSN